MRYAPSKTYSVTTRRGYTSSSAHADAIEWEELPSLAGSLAQRLVWRSQMPTRANDSSFMNAGGYTSPWNETLPATLEALPPSQPFRESIAGLATREVNEPDVFQHFFGPSAQR